MLENKAQNSSGKQAPGSTKFHALSRVIKEGYINWSSIQVMKNGWVKLFRLLKA